MRDIQRVRSEHFEDDSWKPRPGHELYSWLLQISKATTTTVEHIKAHTEANDDDSKLNEAADTSAHLAHHSSLTTILPAITGWMRPYAPYIIGIGYAQDNWKDTLNKSTMEDVYKRQSTRIHRSTLDPIAPNPTVTPEYFYKHSPAGLSAKYQVLTRTGTFMTNKRENQIDPARPATCQYCAHDSQDETHLFVKCHNFDTFRQESIRKGTRLHAGALPADMPGRAERISIFETYAKATTYGTNADPSQFWIGWVPTLPPNLTDMEAKMAHHLAITLTSRIAGSYQRDKAKDRGYGRGKRKGKDKEDGEDARDPEKRRRTGEDADDEGGA